MRILHTSDWHIGKTLYGKKRYQEFNLFFNWLLEVMQQQKVDVLLVAGDIFDTSTPSNQAQELYYRFLQEVSKTGCRHVVIIAGNHDSPAFLDAPKNLLQVLHIHVIGHVPFDVQEEVLVLCDHENTPELIVCAVPYLRDRDVRAAEAGEDFDTKDRKLIEGIYSHYAQIEKVALEKQGQLEKNVPMVAMGHLFVAGGVTYENDGMRELYIGSLGRIGGDLFSKHFTYVALGHLHTEQKVNGMETVRYSGSPLPMGFNELSRSKGVCLAEIKGEQLSVEVIEIPVFQKLEQIRGNHDTIYQRILQLKDKACPVWVEIIYEGDELIGDLRMQLEQETQSSNVEILRIKNQRIFEKGQEVFVNEEIQELFLDHSYVFERCLDANHVPDGQRDQLRSSYKEILSMVKEEVSEL